MPTATLVYNPYSGRYPSWLLVERAARILQEYGWALHLAQTQSGSQITELARQSAQAGDDAFFVVGGDGSINLALPGLIGSETALGVLPAGTANVWAQELGLPGLSWTRWLALEESARLIAQPLIRRVDVGLINDRPFLLWGGVGLDAFLVHRIEPRTAWEKHFAFMHYTATAAWSAGLWRGINLNVEVEGHQISGHFLLALMTNIHLYAGGLLTLSPDALLDDGQMDLWLFKGENVADTVKVAIDLLTGGYRDSDKTSYFQFRNLKITSESHLYAQVDGEPDGASPGTDDGKPGSEQSLVTARVLPRALKVLAPAETPRVLFSHEPVGKMDGRVK
jgi:YegS/Rv2252/BmrU family lipid kinase